MLSHNTLVPPHVPQDLKQPGLLGSALVQLLLDRHAALPPDVEADVLLAASHCFSRAVWFDGCDLLQELTVVRVRAYAAERDSRPLVKIVTGACVVLYTVHRACMQLLTNVDQGC